MHESRAGELGLSSGRPCRGPAPEQLHEHRRHAVACAGRVARAAGDARRAQADRKALHMQAAPEHRLGQRVHVGARAVRRDARDCRAHVGRDHLRKRRRRARGCRSACCPRRPRAPPVLQSERGTLTLPSLRLAISCSVTMASPAGAPAIPSSCPPASSPSYTLAPTVHAWSQHCSRQGQIRLVWYSLIKVRSEGPKRSVTLRKTALAHAA